MRAVSVNDKPTVMLGDRIESVTKKLGIPKCGGCGKMQERLNAGVPFLKALWMRLRSQN